MSIEDVSAFERHVPLNALIHCKRKDPSSNATCEAQNAASANTTHYSDTQCSYDHRSSTRHPAICQLTLETMRGEPKSFPPVSLMPQGDPPVTTTVLSSIVRLRERLQTKRCGFRSGKLFHPSGLYTTSQRAQSA